MMNNMYENSYQKWTAEADIQLCEEYHSTRGNIPSLAQKFKRKPGAIRSRLAHLGIVKREYPAQDAEELSAEQQAQHRYQKCIIAAKYDEAYHCIFGEPFYWFRNYSLGRLDPSTFEKVNYILEQVRQFFEVNGWDETFRQEDLSRYFKLVFLIHKLQKSNPFKPKPSEVKNSLFLKHYLQNRDSIAFSDAHYLQVAKEFLGLIDRVNSCTSPEELCALQTVQQVPQAQPEPRDWNWEPGPDDF